MCLRVGCRLSVCGCCIKPASYEICRTGRSEPYSFDLPPLSCTENTIPKMSYSTYNARLERRKVCMAKSRFISKNKVYMCVCGDESISEKAMESLSCLSYTLSSFGYCLLFVQVQSLVSDGKEKGARAPVCSIYLMDD